MSDISVMESGRSKKRPFTSNKNEINPRKIKRLIDSQFRENRGHLARSSYTERLTVAKRVAHRRRRMMGRRIVRRTIIKKSGKKIGAQSFPGWSRDDLLNLIYNVETSMSEENQEGCNRGLEWEQIARQCFLRAPRDAEQCKEAWSKLLEQMNCLTVREALDYVKIWLVKDLPKKRKMQRRSIEGIFVCDEAEYLVETAHMFRKECLAQAEFFLKNPDEYPLKDEEVEPLIKKEPSSQMF